MVLDGIKINAGALIIRIGFWGDAAMRRSEASFTQGFCPCLLTNRAKSAHKSEQHRESLSIPGDSD